MESILITGGSGYIGSHAAKFFLEKGYHVVVFDNLSHGYEEVVERLRPFGKLDFYKGDLLNSEDLKEVFSKYVFDAVLHFAALCSVNESVENPSLYFRNNVVGSLNLLDALKELSPKPSLVFSSTCATYGETLYVPVDEEHIQNPVNPYGASKLIVEKLINSYSHKYDFKYATLRYFNVCGADPSGVIGDSKRPSPHLVQNIVRGALGIEPFQLTFSEVDSPDGSPVRDYVNVMDLVRAHYLAYLYLKKGGSSDAFNLGTGKGSSVREVIKEVEDVLHLKISVSQGVPRKGEYAQIYASYKKAKDLLGWEPEFSLKDSVLSLKKWYETNPNGYSK